MKNKANLFVCILVALSVNLQCNISVFASDENDTLSTEDLEATVIEPENIEDQQDVTEGTGLTLDQFTHTDENGLTENEQTQ